MSKSVGESGVGGRKSKSLHIGLGGSELKSAIEKQIKDFQDAKAAHIKRTTKLAKKKLAEHLKKEAFSQQKKDAIAALKKSTVKSAGSSSLKQAAGTIAGAAVGSVIIEEEKDKK